MDQPVKTGAKQSPSGVALRRLFPCTIRTSGKRSKVPLPRKFLRSSVTQRATWPIEVILQAYGLSLLTVREYAHLGYGLIRELSTKKQPVACSKAILLVPINMGATCPWRYSGVSSFGSCGHQGGKPCEMESEANRRALCQRAYAMKKHHATRLHYDLRFEWNGTECY